MWSVWQTLVHEASLTDCSTWGQSDRLQYMRPVGRHHSAFIGMVPADTSRFQQLWLPSLGHSAMVSPRLSRGFWWVHAQFSLGCQAWDCFLKTCQKSLFVCFFVCKKSVFPLPKNIQFCYQGCCLTILVVGSYVVILRVSIWGTWMCIWSVFVDGTPLSWWVDQGGERRTYWGGFLPGVQQCSCSLEENCRDMNYFCNCDADTDSW